MNSYMIKRISTATIFIVLLYANNFLPQGKNSYVGSPEKISIPGFSISNNYGEQVMEFSMEPEIKVTINAPSPATFNPAKKVMLIFYGLPNFNSTAQTIGRKLRENDDWHFNIQHIGAQTRFLRRQRTEYNIVVAYLETGRKSWPWWRNSFQKPDSIIHSVADSVMNLFKNFDTEVVLDGHSGGGSFIFGYINSVKSIPDNIKRIAFLDSNYNFENALGHGRKLINWLKRSDDHFLDIICYNDQGVKEDGKVFMNKTSGGFYKTGLMKTTFEKAFRFTAEKDTAFEIYNKYNALNGRLQIIFVENPGKLILHTVLVERNGFIQSINSGTPFEGKNYIFMGAHAYDNWITN